MKMKIRIVSYLFSIVAFFMFFFSIFLSNTKELQIQGIYWFVISLSSSLLPILSKLKLKDIELEFNEKLQKVEKRLYDLEDEFFKSLENIKDEELMMTKEFITRRNRHWDEFQKYIDTLPSNERFEVQKLNSISHLNKFHLTVKDLKQKLSLLNFFDGNIDDDFTEDLAHALTEFQRLNNMRHIDGVFGELTYEKMAELMRAQHVKQK